MLKLDFPVVERAERCLEFEAYTFRKRSVMSVPELFGPLLAASFHPSPSRRVSLLQLKYSTTNDTDREQKSFHRSQNDDSYPSTLNLI